MRGMTGKAAKETAEAAAKAVASSGDEVAKGLRGLWKSRAVRKGAETATEQVGKITDEIAEATSIATKASDEIIATVRGANKELRDGIGVLEREIVTDNREIQRLIRTTQPITEGAIEKLNPVALQRTEQMIKMLETEVTEKVVKKSKLYKLLNISQKRGQERAAINLANKNPELLQVNSRIQGWYSRMSDAQIQSQRVIGYKSKHLGNDTAFIKEFITLKRNPAMSKELDLWTANPSNFTKLRNLMSSDRIAKIINSGKLSIRQKLLGVTMSDAAKRIGVSGAALATGYGAVKVYNWFDNNDPAVASAQGTNIGSSMKTLKVSGEASTVLKGVESSLSNISSISSKVNAGLSKDNASESARVFVVGVSNELDNLTRLLDQWHIVMQSVEAHGGDPGYAEKIGKSLAQYANNLASGLAGLRKQLGLSGPGIAGKVAPRDTAEGTDIKNLTKIQGFLRLNKTGDLDRPTIKALRSLEYKFNKRARTDQFTGTFVIPEIGHVVSYDNLVIAYQKIQKY